jgi:hypothetical protein
MTNEQEIKELNQMYYEKNIQDEINKMMTEIATADELSILTNEEMWQSYYEQWYEEEYTEDDWQADNCEQFEDDKWV